MSASSTIDLNWRNAPKSMENVTSIRRLFADIDSKPSVNLRLGSTTKADAVTLEKTNGVLMLVRHDILSLRGTKKLAGYWTNFVRTATLLNDMAVSKQALKTRFIQYREADPHAKLEVVKRIMYDIALTLQVHPTALGIQQQESGIIRLPHSIGVDNVIVNDVFRYIDRQRTGVVKKDLVPGTKAARQNGEFAIPSPVLDINLKMAGGKIDAVVVVEHKNLSNMLPIKDVLLVMTGGFPSSATKEYLHLLSQSTKLEGVPFLYFGDHDMGGFTIFQTLKYGSKNSAWASGIMVCPQLEYCGPLKSDLLESVTRQSPHQRAQMIAKDPNASSAKIDEQMGRWQEKKDRKVRRKCSHSTKKDMEIMRGFQKLGWLDHEPLVSREINLIIGSKKPAKFRMANMTEVHISHLQRFIEAKLSKRCPSRAPWVAPAPVAPGVQLQNTPSQPPAAGSAGDDELVLETVETGDNQAAVQRSLPLEAELRALAALDIP